MKEEMGTIGGLPIKEKDRALIEFMAEIAHEANRAYCEAIGDHSQVAWAEAPDWQKESARKGVIGVLHGNGPVQSHESWLKEKEAAGWVYGPVKNPAKKTHPCMLPHDQLPTEQRIKDVLFVNVVHVARDLFRKTLGECW